jgi:hypothetical protein
MELNDTESSPATDTEPVEGVRVSREELMRLRVEAARLAAGATDGVAGLFAGGYRSLFRGRGLEFDEVHSGPDQEEGREAG